MQGDEIGGRVIRLATGVAGVEIVHKAMATDRLVVLVEQGQVRKWRWEVDRLVEDGLARQQRRVAVVARRTSVVGESRYRQASYLHGSS